MASNIHNNPRINKQWVQTQNPMFSAAKERAFNLSAYYADIEDSII